MDKIFDITTSGTIIAPSDYLDNIIYAMKCVFCNDRAIRVYNGSSLCEECFKERKADWDKNVK